MQPGHSGTPQQLPGYTPTGPQPQPQQQSSGLPSTAPNPTVNLVVRVLGTLSTVGGLLIWLFLLYILWTFSESCSGQFMDIDAPPCKKPRSNVPPVVGGVSVLLAAGYLFALWKVKNTKGLIALIVLPLVLVVLLFVVLVLPIGTWA